jgi:hypothetical protein
MLFTLLLLAVAWFACFAGVTLAMWRAPVMPELDHESPAWAVDEVRRRMIAPPATNELPCHIHQIRGTMEAPALGRCDNVRVSVMASREPKITRVNLKAEWLPATETSAVTNAIALTRSRWGESLGLCEDTHTAYAYQTIATDIADDLANLIKHTPLGHS